MVEIVCHGLQSCLESQLVDSRVRSLRLTSPKPITPHQPIDIPFKSCFSEPNAKPHCEENSYETNTIHHSNPNKNQSGWSFLQALSNVCKDKETTTTYVHPQVKYSSVRLSPKSLELCTENLGNETGTDDIMDNEINLLSYSSYFSSSWECDETREKKKASQLLRAEKEKTKNFPPPLTTIRGGSDYLKMMPHREGGRLVIEMTKVQPSGSCLQAERSHGRLRLSFLKNPTEEDDDDNEGFEEEEEEVENEMIGQIEDLEGEEETELEGVENNDDERDTCGNSWNIGGGIRIMENKYDRIGSSSSSRCKEGDYENNGFGIAALKFLTA